MQATNSQIQEIRHHLHNPRYPICQIVGNKVVIGSRPLPGNPYMNHTHVMDLLNNGSAKNIMGSGHMFDSRIQQMNQASQKQHRDPPFPQIPIPRFNKIYLQPIIENTDISSIEEHRLYLKIMQTLNGINEGQSQISQKQEIDGQITGQKLDNVLQVIIEHCDEQDRTSNIHKLLYLNIKYLSIRARRKQNERVFGRRWKYDMSSKKSRKRRIPQMQSQTNKFEYLEWLTDASKLYTKQFKFPPIKNFEHLTQQMNKQQPSKSSIKQNAQRMMQAIKQNQKQHQNNNNKSSMYDKIKQLKQSHRQLKNKNSFCYLLQMLQNYELQKLSNKLQQLVNHIVKQFTKPKSIDELFQNNLNKLEQSLIKRVISVLELIFRRICLEKRVNDEQSLQFQTRKYKYKYEITQEEPVTTESMQGLLAAQILVPAAVASPEQSFKLHQTDRYKSISQLKKFLSKSPVGLSFIHEKLPGISDIFSPQPEQFIASTSLSYGKCVKICEQLQLVLQYMVSILLGNETVIRNYCKNDIYLYIKLYMLYGDEGSTHDNMKGNEIEIYDCRKMCVEYLRKLYFNYPVASMESEENNNPNDIQLKQSHEYLLAMLSLQSPYHSQNSYHKFYQQSLIRFTGYEFYAHLLATLAFHLRIVNKQLYSLDEQYENNVIGELFMTSCASLSNKEIQRCVAGDRIAYDVEEDIKQLQEGQIESEQDKYQDSAQDNKKKSFCHGSDLEIDDQTKKKQFAIKLNAKRQRRRKKQQKLRKQKLKQKEDMKKVNSVSDKSPESKSEQSLIIDNYRNNSLDNIDYQQDQIQNQIQKDRQHSRDLLNISQKSILLRSVKKYKIAEDQGSNQFVPDETEEYNKQTKIKLFLSTLSYYKNHLYKSIKQKQLKIRQLLEKDKDEPIQKVPKKSLIYRETDINDLLVQLRFYNSQFPSRYIPQQIELPPPIYQQPLVPYSSLPLHDLIVNLLRSSLSYEQIKNKQISQLSQLIGYAHKLQISQYMEEYLKILIRLGRYQSIIDDQIKMINQSTLELMVLQLINSFKSYRNDGIFKQITRYSYAQQKKRFFFQYSKPQNGQYYPPLSKNLYPSKYQNQINQYHPYYETYTILMLDQGYLTMCTLDNPFDYKLLDKLRQLTGAQSQLKRLSPDAVEDLLFYFQVFLQLEKITKRSQNNIMKTKNMLTPELATQQPKKKIKGLQIRELTKNSTPKFKTQTIIKLQQMIRRMDTLIQLLGREDLIACGEVLRVTWQIFQDYQNIKQGLFMEFSSTQNQEKTIKQMADKLDIVFMNLKTYIIMMEEEKYTTEEFIKFKRMIF